MFRKAFKNANSSVFQVGGENIIMLIISILVAIVLKPLDPFLISFYLPSTISKDFLLYFTLCLFY